MSNTLLIPADGQPITTVEQLNDVLVQVAGMTSGAYQIDLAASASIALTTQLEAINLQPGVTLDIKGNGATLDGQNTTRGLFVYSGAVTVENLTIQNTLARGGDGGNQGGGAGAGLGGGLYVANDSAHGVAAGNVTLIDVIFSNDAAAGGNGGGAGTPGNTFFGGGGGLGGTGGASTNGGGGGGGGIGGNGGLGVHFQGSIVHGGTGATGIVPGATGGGDASVGFGGAGGASGGGGGGGQDGGGAGGGIGGGGTGDGRGGEGGYGGGGGGGYFFGSGGGNGGFGGGGGTGYNFAGNGGFGGGGGGGFNLSFPGQSTGGSGGFGGGNGGGANTAPLVLGQLGGGGGLGAGGAIFVQAGASLSIEGGSLSGGGASGGNGSVGAGNGSAFGSGIFAQGSVLTFGAGDFTVFDGIADQNGSGGAGMSNGIGGTGGESAIVKSGSGTLTLAGVNTYTGATTINAGTLLVDGSITGSAVTVKFGGTLGGHGITGAVIVDAGGTFSPGDSPGQITVASLVLAFGSTFEQEIGGMTAGSGYDQTVVLSGGTISLNGATLHATAYGGFVPGAGVLTIIDNRDPSAAVVGVFDDAQGHALSQGSIVSVGGSDFFINYHGGDGNDVELTYSNAAPTLTATALNPTFTEAAGLGTLGAAVAVFSGANASAIISEQSIRGLTLTVGGLLDGNSETIAIDGTTIALGGDSGGTTAGHGLQYQVLLANGTATITLSSGGIPAAAIDGIIDGITYRDVDADTPTAGQRTITLTEITDNGVNDTTAVSIASIVTVVSVNDAPTATVTSLPGRVGSEILVNTATAGNQLNQQITALDNGGFVVTWQDGGFYPDLSSGPNGSLGVGGAAGDSSGSAIKAQVFAAGGAPVGNEILVNTTTADHQIYPTITALHGGGFVATWATLGSGGLFAAVVQAQVFTAAGAKVGSEIQVDTHGAVNPQIVALADGGFVVLSYEYDTDFKAQMFSATGAAVGSEISVNTGAIAGSITPAITALSGGGFAAMWADPAGNAKAQVFSATGSAVGAEILVSPASFFGNTQEHLIALDNGGFVATWYDGLSVDAQVFTAAGVTVGAQIHIGTGAANSSPQLSALSNGGFVLTWQEFNQPTPAFFTSAVRAQVFDATGGAVGSAITVSATYYNDSSLRPQVNALSNGDFVVTWTDRSAAFYNGSGFDFGDLAAGALKARVFTATGAPVGNEMLVNTATASDQSHPVITALANGAFAVTWMDASVGAGGAGGDASNGAIKAQVFTVNYFATERVALDIKNHGLSISDVDSLGGIETATLSVTEGILNISAGGSGAIVSGTGTGSVTITGTIAQINALLNTDATSSLSYTDSSHDPAPNVTLALAVDDNGHTGSPGAPATTASAIIFVAAVNDAPVNTVPGTFTTLSNVDHVIAGLAVADADAASLVTRLHVDHGTLTVASIGGAAVTGSGTSDVTLTGSIAQINAALGAANNVLYHGASGFSGVDHLTISSNDGGASGAGGPMADTDTVAINVVAMPTVTLAHDTGVSNTDHITSDPRLIFSTPAAGDTFVYKVDTGGFSATAPSFATDGSADGVHTVSVVETDSLGNLGPAGSLTFWLDTIAPHGNGLTASSMSGDHGPLVRFVFNFDEAIDVSGRTPSLSLNNGGSAIYDAVATAALHDATKLTFDYLLSSNRSPPRALAVTGFDAHEAIVTDLAGNQVDLATIAATYSALHLPSDFHLT